jgi:hypothetical protein
MHTRTMHTQCAHAAIIRVGTLSITLSLSLSLYIYIYMMGDAWRLSHELSQVPCKFHHVGSGCGKKDCLFKHAALTDEEREWADRFILESSLYSGFICSKCTMVLTSEDVWECPFFPLKRQWQLGSREHMALVVQVHFQK